MNPKAFKGVVQVISSNNRLQLRFSFAGKRYYLSIGLQDNPVNRKAAEAKARQIELDIISGNFDPTLAKYQPQPVVHAAVKPKIEPKTVSKPSLAELWDKFVEYKRPQCSPNTMRYVYDVLSSYVRKLPTYDLDKVAEIRDYIVSSIPLYSGKRLIARLCACCEWAMESGIILENPFKGMPAKIKLPKSCGSGINEINPFTLEERDAIVKAIEDDEFCPPASGFKHSYYAPLIKFLFATGCRPSEAIALQWKHIAQDFRQITFEQVIIGTDAGKRLRKGLKTQERRKFPCNDSLQSLLKSIKPWKGTSELFVFPSQEGKYIDLNNLRNRTWKTVLLGLGIEYRKLYQTRHTFITHALETGQLDAKDVAKLVGNSPEIIYKYYAGSKRDLSVPEF